MSGLTPEQTEATERIAAAIQAEALQVSESEGTLLDTWVLVSNWVDENGDSWLSRIGPAQLLAHSRDGLLYQALHRMTD